MIKVILKDMEIVTAMNALEIYIAIHLGRYGDIVLLYQIRCEDGIPDEFEFRTEECESYMQYVRDILMPDLRGCSLRGANRGMFNPIVDERARDAYDMLQCIRYVYAWHRHPEGGSSVAFYKPMIRGRFPEPECLACGDDSVKIELCSEQMRILQEAAQVYDWLNNGRICPAFALYTDNSDALHTVGKIETLIPKVENRYIEESGQLLRHIQRKEDDRK